MDDRELARLVDSLIDSKETPTTTKYVFNSASRDIARTIAVIEPVQIFLIDAQFPADLLKAVRVRQSTIFVVVSHGDCTTFDFLLESGNMIFVRAGASAAAILICMLRLAMEIAAMPFIKTIYPCIASDDDAVANEFMAQLRIIAMMKSIVPHVVITRTETPPLQPPLSPQPSHETSAITMSQLAAIRDELIRILSSYTTPRGRKTLLQDTGIMADKFHAWFVRSDNSQLITATVLHWMLQNGYSMRMDEAVIGPKEKRNLFAYRELVIRSGQYDYRINTN